MKELKLLILQGIPASGKSTYAKNLCVKNPKTWVRVCRDDIRSMLGKYWLPKREYLVSRIEEENIMSALEEGYNVVVDATNLNPAQIKRISYIGEFWDTILEAHESNIPNREKTVEIEFKEFKISLRKAIYRDFVRGILGGKRVGAKVIKDFYKRYYG